MVNYDYRKHTTECLHLNVVIDPYDSKDFDGKVEKRLRYVCLDCGKQLLECEDLSERRTNGK